MVWKYLKRISFESIWLIVSTLLLAWALFGLPNQSESARLLGAVAFTLGIMCSTFCVVSDLLDNE